MAAALDVQDLSGLGFSDQEIQTVLSNTNPRERMRLLRDRRGNLLEGVLGVQDDRRTGHRAAQRPAAGLVHTAQQRLDRLDYCIYQLRQNRTAASGR